MLPTAPEAPYGSGILMARRFVGRVPGIVLRSLRLKRSKVASLACFVVESGSSNLQAVRSNLNGWLKLGMPGSRFHCPIKINWSGLLCLWGRAPHLISTGKHLTFFVSLAAKRRLTLRNNNLPRRLPKGDSCMTMENGSRFWFTIWRISLVSFRW